MSVVTLAIIVHLPISEPHFRYNFVIIDCIVVPDTLIDLLLDFQNVLLSVGARIFSTSSRPALRSTQPPIQWVPGALSPGVKRPGRDADHSPRTSAEVKKMWIYTSTPTYAFMA
jgi:hypothetical protein